MEIFNRPYYGQIDKNELEIDKNELFLRLGAKEENLPESLIQKCKKDVLNAINCKYSVIKIQITYLSDDVIDLGFTKVTSKNLYKNLYPCTCAYVFAVTLGLDVDRLISRTSQLSISEHFYVDAIASAYAESACDFAEKQIKNSAKCKARFSPGYGDLSIEYQAPILSVLNAQKHLGITLSKSFLMTPAKTITAILGVIDEHS